MADSALRAQWRAWLVLAVLALLPFGRSSELPLLIAAIAGSIAALRGRLDLRAPAPRLATVLFLAYWLPELLSAFDAVMPRASWREVALDLRYLPFLWFVCDASRTPDAARVIRSGAAVLLALWVIDALLQAATGWSLGGAADADRLSGIFGSEDLKLGMVTAVLSPFLLHASLQRGRWPAVAAFVALLLVILLAGVRAAWVIYALVVLALLWQRIGARRAIAALALCGLLATALGASGYALSDKFAARIERSASVLTWDLAGIDHALAGRLWIWGTAGKMIAAHPVNGIGVRGFRHAYADYAVPGDPWIGFADGAGAMHAHQLVLEILSETGVLGLLCWLVGGWTGLRAWRHATPTQRAAALPAGLALIAMLLPLNISYALYSSAWGALLIWLAAVWTAQMTGPNGPVIPAKAGIHSALALRSNGFRLSPE